MCFVYTKFIMNQILDTKLEKSKKDSKKRSWFKFQFTFSILFIVISITAGFFYFNHLKKKEDFSNNLITNYNIYKLYHMSENNYEQENSNNLFGIIEIPKINLYYPIFSNLTEELLKISPCKFFGDTPNINGNICIAGHNYDNSLFFSKISTLLTNDEIFIYDTNDNKYVYLVYDIYEVDDSDLSPIFNYDSNEKILTLVTCNNLNSNRIILKAKQ